MNPCCCICSDLFAANDELSATPCGHAFHRACLTRWLEKGAPSCPQCRKKTDARSALRLYLNPTPVHGVELDAPTLQAKLDEADFENRQRAEELRKSDEEKRALQDLLRKLESDVQALEKKVRDKGGTVEVLRDRLEYMKTENAQISQLRADNQSLKSKLDTLTSLRTIIDGTSAEVESMVRNVPDVEKLSTYIVVLKKSVKQSEAKKKAVQENLRALQSELNAANAEKTQLSNRCKLLESSASHYEDKYKELQKRLTEYEVQDSIVGDAGTSATPSPVRPEPTAKLKRPTFELHADLRNLKKARSSPDVAIAESSSPYLCLKQNGGALTKLFHKPSAKMGTKTEFYILKNKKLSDGAFGSDMIRETAEKRERLETSYDGLGGHAKPDVFPTVSPKKTIRKGLMNFKKKL